MTCRQSASLKGLDYKWRRFAPRAPVLAASRCSWCRKLSVWSRTGWTGSGSSRRLAAWAWCRWRASPVWCSGSYWLWIGAVHFYHLIPEKRQMIQVEIGCDYFTNCCTSAETENTSELSPASIKGTWTTTGEMLFGCWIIVWCEYGSWHSYLNFECKIFLQILDYHDQEGKFNAQGFLWICRACDVGCAVEVSESVIRPILIHEQKTKVQIHVNAYLTLVPSTSSTNDRMSLSVIRFIWPFLTCK